jgi:serine/threonine-protein kinase
MTKTTSVMGSPLYMSPEQMASTRDVDARTDIWALGAILFELLSGRVPFDAETMPQLCAMILQHPPPLLRTYRPDAPEGLQRIVLRCLEKDRNYRFTNVAELALALGEFGPRQSRTSVERIVRVLQAAGLTATTKSNSYPVEQPSAAVSSSASTATMSAWGQSGVAAKRSKRKTGAIALAVVAAVLLAGVAAFVAHRAHGPENPVVTAPTSDIPAPKEPPASPELAKDRPPQAPVPSDLGANNASNATNLAGSGMPAPGTIDAASGKVGRPHDGSRAPVTQVTKGHPSPAAPPAVAPPGTSPHAPEPKPPAADLYLDRK